MSVVLTKKCTFGAGEQVGCVWKSENCGIPGGLEIGAPLDRSMKDIHFFFLPIPHPPTIR